MKQEPWPARAENPGPSGPGEVNETPEPDLQAQLERQIAGNLQAKREFAQLAGPAGLMGLELDLLNMRVFTLARMLLGDGSDALARFQLIFEQQSAEVIASAAAEIRKMRMAASAAVSPQQLRTMAAGQGLLGPDGRPLS